MDSNEIFAKTAAGTEEVRARALKLPQRLRTVLIMADGTQSFAQLQAYAAKLGAPEDAVQTLFGMGLIAPLLARQPVAKAAGAAAQSGSVAPVGAPGPADALLPTPTEGERFRAAQKFMNDSAVDVLGLRAFFFTLKLEKCYTSADLLALLPEFTKAVTKGSGEQVARILEARAREMLG